METGQRTTMLVCTGIMALLQASPALLVGTFKGSHTMFLSVHPELVAYNVASALGAATIPIAIYILGAIGDAIVGKKRFKGWLKCAGITWASLFVFGYVIAAWALYLDGPKAS